MRVSPPFLLLCAAMAAAAVTSPRSAFADHCSRTVVIGQGDTLSAVAERCGTDVNGLLQGNPYLGDPRSLAVGTEIVIPGHGSGPVAGAAPGDNAQPALPAYLGTYVTGHGESLSRIARKFDLSAGYLRAINPAQTTDRLKSGTTIRLRMVPASKDAEGKVAGISSGTTR